MLKLDLSRKKQRLKLDWSRKNKRRRKRWSKPIRKEQKLRLKRKLFKSRSKKNSRLH